MNDIFIDNGNYIINTRDWPNTRYHPLVIKSPKTIKYNCAAFAVGQEDYWFECADESLKQLYLGSCEFHWPENILQNASLNAYIELYEQHGFEKLSSLNADFVGGVTKIALYGKGDDFMHASKQMPDGRWASKLGPLQDVEHDNLRVLEGPTYGMVKAIMQKS
jgi:hypothetical protein